MMAVHEDETDEELDEEKDNNINQLEQDATSEGNMPTVNKFKWTDSLKVIFPLTSVGSFLSVSDAYKYDITWTENGDVIDRFIPIY